LAKYCGIKLPEADFTAVEISPSVIALRDAFGIPPDGPRFHVVCADGAEFVRQDAEPFDVLLVDGFDRGGQPEQLCSAAFYDYCHDRLAPGGVLVANLYSDDAARGPIDRIRDSFAGKLIAIQAEESGNKIVFASTAAAFPPTFSQLVERLRRLEATHPVALDVTLRKVLRLSEARPALRRRPKRRPPAKR
jgi:spermidine synthase